MSTQCKESEKSLFYNTPNYNCQNCGTNAIRNPFDSTQCVCKPGFYKKDKKRFDFLFECIPCQGDTLPTRDATECFPKTTNVKVDKDSTGTIITKISCFDKGSYLTSID